MSDVEQWEHDEQRAMENEITTLREQVERLTEESVVLRASSHSKLETISSLELQVEKLTKERDFWRDGCQKEKLSAIDWAGKHQAQLLDHETQLAALAEQNEKFRKLLPYCNTGRYGYSIQQMYFEVAQLPDLASPVLNRIRAEGMRMAADICSEKHSLSGAEEAIRARADELEASSHD